MFHVKHEIPAMTSAYRLATENIVFSTPYIYAPDGMGLLEEDIFPCQRELPDGLPSDEITLTAAKTPHYGSVLASSPTEDAGPIHHISDWRALWTAVI
jgi:hypothetical protein